MHKLIPPISIILRHTYIHRTLPFQLLLYRHRSLNLIRYLWYRNRVHREIEIQCHLRKQRRLHRLKHHIDPRDLSYIRTLKMISPVLTRTASSNYLRSTLSDEVRPKITRHYRARVLAVPLMSLDQSRFPLFTVHFSCIHRCTSSTFWSMPLPCTLPSHILFLDGPHRNHYL